MGDGKKTTVETRCAGSITPPCGSKPGVCKNTQKLPKPHKTKKACVAAGNCEWVDVRPSSNAGCKGTKTDITRPCNCPHGELYRRNGFLPLAEDSSDECDQCRGTGENANTCSGCGAAWCPRKVDTLSPDMTIPTPVLLSRLSRDDRRRLVRKETASQRVMRRLLAGDREPVPLYDSASCE